MSTPKHDEHSHGSDAMRYFAMAKKSGIIMKPYDEYTNSLDYVRAHSNRYSGA